MGFHFQTARVFSASISSIPSLFQSLFLIQFLLSLATGRKTRLLANAFEEKKKFDKIPSTL